MVYFLTKNPNLGKSWRVLQRKMFDIFGLLYGHLVYILCGHLVFCGFLVYFFLFWYVEPGKIWQPCSEDNQQKIKYFFTENILQEDSKDKAAHQIQLDHDGLRRGAGI
jgi:hypothetical protein